MRPMQGAVLPFTTSDAAGDVSLAGTHPSTTPLVARAPTRAFVRLADFVSRIKSIEVPGCCDEGGTAGVRPRPRR